MTRVTFNNTEMAIEYVDRLYECGMNSVEEIEELDRNTFCVIGKDVYFFMNI